MQETKWTALLWSRCCLVYISSEFMWLWQGQNSHLPSYLLSKSDLYLILKCCFSDCALLVFLMHDWMLPLFIFSSQPAFLLTLSQYDMCQVLSWRKGWSQPDSYCSNSSVTFRCSVPCWLSCSSTDFPTLFTWHLQVQPVPTSIVLSKHSSCTRIPLIVSTKATGFSPVRREQNLLL